VRIFVDADSCAREARAILAKASLRPGVKIEFVANKHIPLPEGLSCTVVENMTADDYIAERSSPGALIVTRDIPLAARVIDTGAACINDRGDEFSANTIRERLSQRDFSLKLRLSGLAEAGGRSYGSKESRAFANCLDKAICRLLK
jgi:uncharacterized protein